MQFCDFCVFCVFCVFFLLFLYDLVSYYHIEAQQTQKSPFHCWNKRMTFGTFYFDFYDTLSYAIFLPIAKRKILRKNKFFYMACGDFLLITINNCGLFVLCKVVDKYISSVLESSSRGVEETLWVLGRARLRPYIAEHASTAPTSFTSTIARGTAFLYFSASLDSNPI